MAKIDKVNVREGITGVERPGEENTLNLLQSSIRFLQPDFGDISLFWVEFLSPCSLDTVFKNKVSSSEMKYKSN